MKVLVFGSGGYVGRSFLENRPGWIGSRVEITDPVQVASAIDEHQPDVVLNCAGKTGRPNIDWCEKNAGATVASNVTGPLVILNQCLRRNVKMVQIGSGCIYQGDNGGIGFGEKDRPNYFGSLYSRTKILADQALLEFPVLILRMRMPFDGTTNPRNLIQRLTNYQRVLDVANSMTCLPEFIEAACMLIERGSVGVFHIANPGLMSPYQVMCRYREIVDPSHEFERMQAEDLAKCTVAGRSNCTLSVEKLRRFGIELTGVESAVDRACHDIKRKGTTLRPSRTGVRAARQTGV